MDTREQRGHVIASAGRLRQKDHLWIVPSQAGAGTYIVEPAAPPTCTCPDFETRGEKCKHIFAVEYTIRLVRRGDGVPTISESVRVTYRQDWPAYNAAQTAEKEKVAALLHDLCDGIDNPTQKNGRPRLALSDTIFAAVMKVYGGTSGRRAMVDMHDYAAKGYISHAPHFNSISNVLEEPSTMLYLKVMIEESARPLRAVETDFAVDSSGFTTTVYERWFDKKYGREVSKSQWVKAHIMVGTTTNVVTSVEVTDANTHDIHAFRPLFDRAKHHFDIKRVSADKAYSSARTLALVDSIGATAYVPFKVNAKGTTPDKFAPHRAKQLWGLMFDLFSNRRDEFLAHYHKRSNVETAFHMIKSKFGSRLRSKSVVAQVNEVLCKVLCHNLCCLVQASYELGVDATFWNSEQSA